MILTCLNMSLAADSSSLSSLPLKNLHRTLPLDMRLVLAKSSTVRHKSMDRRWSVLWMPVMFCSMSDRMVLASLLLLILMMSCCVSDLVKSPCSNIALGMASIGSRSTPINRLLLLLLLVVGNNALAAHSDHPPGAAPRSMMKTLF